MMQLAFDMTYFGLVNDDGRLAGYLLVYHGTFQTRDFFKSCFMYSGQVGQQFIP